MNDKLKKGLVTVTLSAFLIFATSIYDVQAVELEPIQFTDIAGHWASQDIAFIQKKTFYSQLKMSLFYLIKRLLEQNLFL